MSAPAPKLQEFVHGRDCNKVEHGNRSGHLHAPDDDSPFNDDGVWYCGRCHVFLDRRDLEAARRWNRMAK